MMSRLTAAIALAIALAFASPGSAAPEDEVATVAREWAKTFAEHNVDKMVAFYSKGAVLWGTNGVSLRTTPEEVREFFQSSFRIPNIKITFDSQVIRVFGNV